MDSTHATKNATPNRCPCGHANVFGCGRICHNPHRRGDVRNLKDFFVALDIVLTALFPVALFLAVPLWMLVR